MAGGSALNRRRALQITAAACGSALLPLPAGATVKDYKPMSWRGVALGAPAEITLYAEDARVARDALRHALLEIRRLEAIFSLHDARSAIARLNRDGSLTNPPLDLVRLISTAKGIGATTDGAFDLTIQPLWTLYARHYSRQPEPTTGPDVRDLRRALALVDYRAVRLAADHIAFEKTGMAISLNGIAQGFITDRVAELLGRSGFEHVLLNLGEIRGVGSHPSGRPWSVGITSSVDKTPQSLSLEITDRAVATSAPMGTPLNTSGTAHHLFDPRTGACAAIHRSVTVTAKTATLADAYSTAFAIMKWPEMLRVAKKQKEMRVDAISASGRHRMVS